jgi:hypothetical protein
MQFYCCDVWSLTTKWILMLSIQQKMLCLGACETRTIKLKGNCKCKSLKYWKIMTMMDSKNIKAATWQYFSLQRANKCTQFLWVMLGDVSIWEHVIYWLILIIPQRDRPYTQVQIHIYKSNKFQIQRHPQNSRNYICHEKMQTNTFPHQCHCATLPKSNAHSSVRLHSLKSSLHSQNSQLSYTFALSLTEIQTLN